MGQLKLSKETVTPDAVTNAAVLYPEGSSIKYRDEDGTVYTLSTGVTPEEVEDIVAAILVAGTDITIVHDDPGDTITISLEATASSNLASAFAHISLTNNPHSVTATQVGLGNVNNTSDNDKPVSTAQAAADTAVQNFSIQRSNHTGTQTASTISDFAAEVRNTVLTGISFATSTAVVATDTILEAIGKLQAQLNNNKVFGDQAEDFEDLSNVSYTTNTLFEAYSFTTQSNPAGRYRVSLELHYEPGATNANDLFQLRIDGTQIGLEYEDEGKDTGGDIRRIVKLCGYYQHASAGTFDIQLWAAQDGGGTTVIHGVTAEVWRVS